MTRPVSMGDGQPRVTAICQAAKLYRERNLIDWDNPRVAGLYDRCESPCATHRVSSGCLHEHVLTWDVCASCAEVMQTNVARDRLAQCVACSRLHGKCPVIVAIEPLPRVIA